MKTNDTGQKAHEQIDYIFSEILPVHGMAERREQIALSHRMLDAMLDGGIALCDAGTGIGKTYAYLVAGMSGPPAGCLRALSSSPPPASPSRTRCRMRTCRFCRSC